MSTRLRKMMNIFTTLIAAAVIFLLVFLSIESVRLGWWLPSDSAPLPQLTPAQKAEDMRYLLDLTREVSSADAAWAAGGLENPLDFPETWIERARQTKNNLEFLDLILQFSVHLQQVGHGGLVFDWKYNPVDSLIHDIPKKAFDRAPLWQQMLPALPWYAHADLDIVYQQGEYRLASPAKTASLDLPAGARVVRVDGQPVSQYVLGQQYRDFLYFDPLLNQWFLYPLLRIDPGLSRSTWNVAFVLPDGSQVEAEVEKHGGWIGLDRPLETAEDNIRCVILTDTVLYIRAATFYYDRFQSDARALRSCFDRFGPQADHLIVDVRGNDGGEIWSYIENLIAPLAKKDAVFTITAAVKDSFYRRWGWRFWYYQLINSNELTDARTRVSRIETLNHHPLASAGWQVRRVTRTVPPAENPYPFSGRISVLADQVTLSAGDSFTAAMQQSGMARVYGANTNGLGSGYQARTVYALPNSGMMLYMDAELTLNPDGSFNQISGTLPDVFLSPSTFPTAFPADFSREALLADPWIQAVIQSR